MKSMLDEITIRDAARRLDESERSRTQIRQLSIQHPGMTIDDAYSVQKAWVALKTAAGRAVRGHKIGLTSKAMQSSSNINEPDYGVLLDNMFFADGSSIPTDRFIVPRLEVELAFVLAKPLAGPNCTIFDVLSATDYVTPAVEIIDARIQQVDPETKATRKVFDTISDNAAGAALVAGGRPFRPMDTDLRWVSAVCYRNGAIEESGVAAAVLNHPANGVAWLANKFAAHNVSLAAGELILGGSFTRPVPARRGDTFHIDYGPFGCISCHFE
jgi:2-oxo-hept-3-ene-1,7-dioate hydratase